MMIDKTRANTVYLYLISEIEVYGMLGVSEAIAARVNSHGSISPSWRAPVVALVKRVEGGTALVRETCMLEHWACEAWVTGTRLWCASLIELVHRGRLQTARSIDGMFRR